MNPFYLTLSIFLLRIVMGLRLVFPGWMMIQKHKDKRMGWTFFLIGLALTFGIFSRFAGYIGIIFVAWQWYVSASRKKEIFTEWLVYIAVFLLLIVVNAGIWWGFDYLLLQIPAVLKFYQANQWFQWIL